MPKFSSCPGLSPTLSWKWRHPTLSPSFGLFLERNHSFGVFHGSQFFTKRSEYAPVTTFHVGKKNLLHLLKEKRCSKICELLHFGSFTVNCDMSIYANIYRFWALLPVYIKFSWPDFLSRRCFFGWVNEQVQVQLYSCAAQTKAERRPASLWNNIVCATAVKLQIQCWHEIVNARKGANSLGGMSQDLKTNMVQKMDVCFWNFTIRSLVVELLARARKGRACVHARNGANSLGGMSQD